MMIIETILGMVFLTASASPVPEQYVATAFALPGVSLSFRGYDGWVAPQLCYDRCNTVPGQDNRLLRGEFTERELADLQLTVWRKDGDTWVQVMHCAHFFPGPTCTRWRK